MTTLTAFEAAQMIDHAVLKPQMSRAEKEQEIKGAALLNAWSVCVNPKDISLALGALSSGRILSEDDTKVCAVIGFPNSTGNITQKVNETAQAIQAGADEIDYVIDVSAVKSGDYNYIEREASRILRKAQHELGADAVCKAIYETAYLTDDEIRLVSEVMVGVGMPFIKTSTGFAHEGATERSVSIMCEFITDVTQVKASGGVRDMDTFVKFYDMGVRRFGTSNTEAITQGSVASSDY